MSNELKSTTIAIKPCVACEAALIETDKYCRRCGSPQLVIPGAKGRVEDDVSRRTVGMMRRLDKSEVCHPVSGLLVKAVARGLPAASSTSTQELLSRRLILAFISIPIWLMIVLLSPLDAYTAAKIISNRI